MFYYANSQVHESVPVRSLSPRRPVEHNDLQMRERVMHAAIVQSKNHTKSQGHRDPAIGCNSPVSSDPTQPQYELLHCIPLAGDIGPNFNGYARGSAFPLTSKRRAILLRHFMDNLSPLYDATNTDEDFRRTVPARAGDHPILLYSLLTLSSRHLAFLNGVDSLEAEELYNESLNLLIPILNNPEAMADETILASAVLLRLYEELTAPYTGSDEENHLSGINLYISALKKQHDSSKHTHLAQTVFDVFLRQDLYTSIRNSHPLKLKTGYYPLDIPAYLQGRSKEHCQWATCAVRIVAHIANFCFDQVVKDVKEWRHLQNYLQTWRERCPALFTPYYYEEEKGEGEASYPQMWLWQIWHSLQYYHLGRILLAIHDPQSYPSGGMAPSAWRKVEKTVVHHLRFILGMAISSKHIHAYVIACHSLCAGGPWCRSDNERQGAISFLERTERTHGWPTQHIVRRLQREWNEE